MKNEEKILGILESMHSDIKSLKQGQSNLEKGQAATNSRLDVLEKGQTELQQGQTELQKGMAAANSRLDVLEKGQTATNSRLDVLGKGLSTANSRLDTVEESLTKLSQSQARMENQLTEHIKGLWDFQSVQADVNNRVLAALERIENKIEKHDIQIQVLEMTKSDKRKIK